MSKATLETVLKEIKKLSNKVDDQFEIVKTEFQSVRSDIEELRTETKTEFASVGKNLKIIRDQAARLTEEQAGLKTRVRKLEVDSSTHS